MNFVMQLKHTFNILVVEIIHLQCQNNECHNAYGSTMGIMGFSEVSLFLRWKNMYSHSTLILFLIHFLHFQ